MDQLKQRVAQLTEDLRTIQTELEHPTSPGGVAIPAAPDEVLLELKAAVDRMRLFLWAYFDSRGAKHKPLDTTLQVLRVQRAAEMLHVLRTNLELSGLPSTPSIRDLLNEIRAMADIADEERGQKSA
ncbi:MAG TPA: hypothetical protein VFU76_02220 [Terriglobales bacterium]|nr:hypothetical protein [Terriglobales bacterium]